MTMQQQPPTRTHVESASAATSPGLRAIALYLPQYHPIPENDAWWGKGFTEWTNVSRACPLLPGQYQPHLPADLGFCDLRVPETRAAQADLAREHGIHGFCYYHYWFNGRRLLERPFHEVLASGQPDFPFCLCWANENWTRTWDGLERNVLVEQVYSEADDRAHMRWLCENAFSDPRYIRVNGRPLFVVYRSLRIPDLRRTLDTWRDEARRCGVGEVYLCRFESFPDEHVDPAVHGFDASIEFQPDWANIGVPLRKGRAWQSLTRLGLSSPVYQHSRIWEYAEVMERMLAKPDPGYKRFPAVTPMWDNTARRKTDLSCLLGSTPELYERWLEGAAARFRPYSAGENLLFLNAWNEWGEGNHLEPCQKWGRAYLEATARVLRRYPPAAADHAPAPAGRAGMASPSAAGVVGAGAGR